MATLCCMFISASFHMPWDGLTAVLCWIWANTCSKPDPKSLIRTESLLTAHLRLFSSWAAVAAHEHHWLTALHVIQKTILIADHRLSYCRESWTATQRVERI